MAASGCGIHPGMPNPFCRTCRDHAADRPPEPVGCPDAGVCGHDCQPGACFRVHNAAPLSGAYPGGEWPDAVRSAWADGGVL